MKKNNVIKILVISFLILVTFSIGGFIVYANVGVYQPSADAVSKLDSAIYKDKYIEFKAESNVGFIFYPGGKVNYEAYSYLGDLTDDGINVYIPKMPFNLAFLDVDAAQKIIDEHKEITTWYIGGHSLGGVAATMFASENKNIINGIILLASYPAKDLSDLDIPTLALYAENDGLVTALKRNEVTPLLPNETDLLLISGGNHAQFGDYGNQSGDLNASITIENQHDIVIEKILSFINE